MAVPWMGLMAVKRLLFSLHLTHACLTLIIRIIYNLIRVIYISNRVQYAVA